MSTERFTDSDVLIVGLGNPGKEYANTRHNAGFMVIDRLFEELGGATVSGGWKSKFHGYFASFSSSGRKVILLKPDTYMNDSGKSVQAAAKFFQVSLESFCVVHDDLDFPLGTVRFKSGGGDGGHNGLKSISRLLSSKSYLRLRFGIGRPNIPQNADIRGDMVHSWVLGKFSNSENLILREAIDSGEDALQLLLRDGLERAQNLVNQRGG